MPTFSPGRRAPIMPQWNLKPGCNRAFPGRPVNFPGLTFVFLSIYPGGVTMRRNAVFLVLALLFASVALAQRTVEVTEVGKEPVKSDFPSGGLLRMELCASGVEIRGTGKKEISLSYDSPEDTSEVKVRLKISGNKGRVEVEGCPHENFHITIEVPSLADLHVRMWAGELEVEGVTGSKDLELHAGQLEVDIGRAEDYAWVDASVMTGEVDAAPFEVSKGGLFRSFERKGPGKYRLHAHVGAGQVVLTQDPSSGTDP